MNAFALSLFHWLQELGYQPNQQQLEQRLLSHPYPGTARAITDSLTEFGIESVAIELLFEEAYTLSDPFFTLLKKPQEEEQWVMLQFIGNKAIIYANQKKSTTVSIAELSKSWSGIIIAADKNTIPKKKLSANYLNIIRLAVLFCCISTVFSLRESTIIMTAYFITSLVGLTISGMLFLQQTNYSPSWLQPFCNISQKINCKAVLQSASSKLYKNISWTDIGIIFFATQLFFFLVGSSYTLWLYISLVAAIFPVYSIYQQAVVLKNWCPLCIAIVCLLFIQAVISSYGFYNHSTNLSSNFNALLQLIAFGLITGTIWFFIKPYFQYKSAIHRLKIENYSFRRNIQLFTAHYQQTPALRTTQLQQYPVIQLGNGFALVQLTLLTNPVCEHCKTLYYTLQLLLQQYSIEIGLKVIFHVPHPVAGTIAGAVATQLTEAWLQNPNYGEKLINEWYTNQGLPPNTPARQNPSIAQCAQIIIENNGDWCNQNQLHRTPLLLINDKLFPSWYAPGDIVNFIEELLIIEKQYNAGTVGPTVWEQLPVDILST
jgi:uncharacterized membrane protein